MNRAAISLSMVLMLAVGGTAWAQDDYSDEEAPMEEGMAPAPAAAPAQQVAADEDPPLPPGEAPPPGDMYVALNVGPGIGVEEYDGTIFFFGPEFGLKNFSIPLLFGFKDEVKHIHIIPRFKYPIEMMKKLYVSPFGGVKLGVGLADGATMMDVGLEIGARAAYFFNSNLGIFIEPVVLDIDFYHWWDIDGAGSDSDTDLAVMYRLNFGAEYHF